MDSQQALCACGPCAGDTDLFWDLAAGAPALCRFRGEEHTGLWRGSPRAAGFPVRFPRSPRRPQRGRRVTWEGAGPTEEPLGSSQSQAGPRVRASGGPAPGCTRLFQQVSVCPGEACDGGGGGASGGALRTHRGHRSVFSPPTSGPALRSTHPRPFPLPSPSSLPLPSFAG